MDEATAKTFHALATGFDRDLAAMSAAITRISDDTLRARLDRAVGDIRGAVARDLVFPIERLHPALRAAP